MMWLWLTAGMLIRAVHLSVFDFRKRDIVVALVVVNAGLFYWMLGILVDDENFLLPLIVAFAIAVTYKDRLLPLVTEGTLFGYSLIACYLFFLNLINGTGIDFISLLLMGVSISLTLSLLLYTRPVNQIIQLIAMVVWLCLSVYIGYELIEHTISINDSRPFISINNKSGWELLIIGYGCVILLANTIYLYHLHPLARRPFLARKDDPITDFFRHLTILERKYIAVNSTPRQILLTFTLFVLLVVFNLFNFVSEPLLISIMLSFMVFVNKPPKNGQFIVNFRE